MPEPFLFDQRGMSPDDFTGRIHFLTQARMTGAAAKGRTNEILVREEDGNRIAEVVVFMDRAHLKRRARVEVVAGRNRILVEVEAFEVASESALAQVRGDGNILSVQYRELPADLAPQEDVADLEQKGRELARRRKAL